MSAPSESVRGWRKWRLPLAGAGAVAAAIVGGGLLLSGGETDAAASATPTFATAQGPLTISVTESGTITARDQEVIKNEVEGRTTIISLVDEGVLVRPGDLLVELDSSALQTQLLDQEIKVQNAEATMIQMREELAVALNQAQADIAQAKLNYDFAVQDLAKYVEGEYPKLLQEAEMTATLAKETLDQARQTLEWSDKLFAEQYISQSELDKDRTALRRAELEHEVALKAKELLAKYERARQLATLESNVEQMKLALERTERSARAAVVKAEANARAKEAEFTRESDKRAKLEDQIAKCTMRAPVEGMVVYSTTGKANWRGNEEPLAEGTEVRERQELIYLPTAGAMQAEVKIHESSLEKIARGMPVRVSIDALPGKSFSGRVSKISPLPDGQSVWMNPDLKVYATTIDLEGNLAEVRTGMTCRAEILVEHYADATYVPVQSVVRVNGKPTVYVRDGAGFTPREVELGLSNNRMVRVVSGLSSGEVVSLAPPLAPATMGEDSAFAKGEDAEAIRGMIAQAKEAGIAAPVRPAADGVAAAPAATGAGAVVAAGGAAPAAAGGPGGGEAPTAEQREAWRKRMESMTEEERERAREQFRQRREAAGAGAAPAVGAGS